MENPAPPYLACFQDPEMAFETLRAAVIVRLQDGITSREQVLAELEDLRAFLTVEELENQAELVLDVMDHVVGWCDPTWSLRDRGFSNLANSEKTSTL